MSGNLLSLMRDIQEDMRWLPEHLARIVTKRAEAILYEIAPDCCQFGPTGCKGKLVTSLEKQGRNFPVCQEHYAFALSDPTIRQKAQP